MKERSRHKNMFCKKQHISPISKSEESFVTTAEIGIKPIMASSMISLTS